MDMQGQQTLMRIFIGEQDQFEGKSLYQAILELLKTEKLAGATAWRGIAGYGANSHIHSAHLLALSQDLPIVIECVDNRQKIERVLPALKEMLSGGLVTLENIEVIRYAPKTSHN